MSDITFDLLPGQPTDIQIIMELIHAVTIDMENKGIDQWGGHYPLPEHFLHDIEDQGLWLAWHKGGLLATITHSERETSEWQDIQWLYPAPALVVKRLAVHPSAQKQGIAHQLMDFTETRACRLNFRSIRLDAYSANPAALALYQSRGYRNAGSVVFPQRSCHGYCFEKLLDSYAV